MESDVGLRVALKVRPRGWVLDVGAKGTVVSVHQRYVEVQFDGMRFPQAMRVEELEVVKEA